MPLGRTELIEKKSNPFFGVFVLHEDMESQVNPGVASQILSRTVRVPFIKVQGVSGRTVWPGWVVGLLPGDRMCCGDGLSEV